MHIKIKQGRRNMNLEPVSTNKNKKNSYHANE